MSPTYSVCRDHGYLTGEQYTCPCCGQDTEVYSRITGYYRPVRNWNDGKAQEFKDRKVYDLNRSSLRRAGAAGSPVTVEGHVPAGEPVSELLLFATRTCPNCRLAEQMLRKAGLSYRKVLAEEEPELAVRYAVRQAPTLVANGGGEPLRLAGLSSVKKYIDALRPAAAG